MEWKTCLNENVDVLVLLKKKKKTMSGLTFSFTDLSLGEGLF